MAGDINFNDAVIDTFEVVLLAVPLQLALALGMALMLRHIRHGRDIVLWVWSIPLGISDLAAGLVWLAILTDRGSSSQLAAFASSLFGVGLFMGRVGCGYLLDQFFAPRVAALLFSAVAIGIAFLGLGHAIWSACIAAVLVGLGIGAEVDIIAYLTSRYFGLRSYGAICGWIWAVFGVS